MQIQPGSGKPKHKWANDVKMCVTEMGWEGLNWMHLAQDRDKWQALVNTVMNLWVPQNSGSFSTSQRINSISERTLSH
jgi:hypothetical protein